MPAPAGLDRPSSDRLGARHRDRDRHLPLQGKQEGKQGARGDDQSAAAELGKYEIFECLAGRTGDRAVSRLFEMCAIVRIETQDFA
jgi:hypothetical protein